MKNTLIVISCLGVLVGSIFAFGGEGTNGTHMDPFDFISETLRTKNIAQGNAVSDSLIVHNDATDYYRRVGINDVKNAISSLTTYNNAPGRTIVTSTTSTGVQLSATKATRVSYSITHTIALTLVVTSGSSNVFLEISPNNTAGSWVTINQAGYADGVAVAVVLNKIQTNNVQGEIPAGYYVRLRSVTAGGGSAALVNGQEVN